MDTHATATTTTTNGAAIEETGRLIASDKVEGTAVYNRRSERLGTVHNFMVDKLTGRVAYAVMSFGGFLGIGESYHPLPWRVLSYDTGLNGYVVDIDRNRLENAPHYNSAVDAESLRERDRIDAYYAIPPA